MPLSARQRNFNREIETLRALIQSKAKPFADDKKAQRERTRRGEKDLEFFGQSYFPHYWTRHLRRCTSISATAIRP